MKTFRCVIPAIFVFGASATAALGRQPCGPSSPAQPAPALNPIALHFPGQEQWFTIPVFGGHVYDLSFAIPVGASVRAKAFGGDCLRPLTSEYFDSSPLPRTFTVPLTESQLQLWIQTTPEFIEPVMGTFQLADRGPTVDDIPSDPSWARPLAADGVWVDGAIDYNADRDPYRLTTVPGSDYRVEVRGTFFPGCFGDYRFNHEGSAAWLFRATGASVLVPLPVCQPTSATPLPYQIRVVAVTEPIASDQPGECTGAAAAPVGEVIRGEATSSDSDAFAWPLLPRHQYQVTLLGENSRAELRWDTCDTRLITHGASGGRTVFVTDRAGTLLAVVASTGSVPSNTPYELRLDDLGAVPPEEPDQLADARPLMAGNQEVHGAFDREFDSDVFRLPVDPGWVYEFMVRGRALATLIDPRHSQGNATLAGAHSTDPDGTDVATARLLMPSNETNFRWVILQSVMGETPNPYSIAVRRTEFVGDVDQPDDPAAATPVNIHGPIDFHFGSISDADWVVFNGPPNRKYRVSSVGATPDAGGVDLMFGSHGAGCELNPNGDSTTLETDADGRLFFGGVSWSNLPTTVTATATDIGPATDTVPDVPSDVFAVRPNRDTIRGQLDSGNDHDVYTLLSRPGHAYRIVLRQTAGLGPFGALVRPTDSYATIRAFGVAYAPPGEPELWSASPRLTLPAGAGTYVLDMGASGNPIVATPFQVRVEAVCRADWNDDGGVGVSDLFDYLVDYLSAPQNAEFDHIGDVTIDDLYAFIGAFIAACP